MEVHLEESDEPQIGHHSAALCDECFCCGSCSCCTRSSSDSHSSATRTRGETSWFSRTVRVVRRALCCVSCHSSCSHPPSSGRSQDTEVQEAMERLSVQSESDEAFLQFVDKIQSLADKRRRKKASRLRRALRRALSCVGSCRFSTRSRKRPVFQRAIYCSFECEIPTSRLASSPKVVHETQFHKCDQRSAVQDEVEVLSVQSEGEATADIYELEVMEKLVSVEHRSTTNTVTHTVPKSSDPGLSRRDNSSTQSNSSPDTELKNSFEEFTPVITVDGDVETYRFQCSCPGLYLCSVTGLMFDMKGEGDVVYRIVPWNRRLLRQHHKKPAGPLFDITCVQQSVCQLHLPHCEISSTGGCQFLSVAHVKDDEDVEYISPHEITETHVVINITGFSGYGNVKEEDSPPDPVRSLVLLFYRPPADPDLTSFLSVLLLPRNIVLRDVQRKRKASVGDERYIETSSHCKLHPDQFYTLSTCPQDNSVKVQPKQAEFDLEFDDNYIPSFQVILKTIIKNIELFLRDTNSSLVVWESEVCLPVARKRKLCEESALNLPTNEKLKKARSRFIDGISEPVVKSLLDKLLEKKVITDSERESVDTKQNREDKARLVIDTVRKKGEAASSDMIEVLCELDPSLCEHLGLE